MLQLFLDLLSVGLEELERQTGQLRGMRPSPSVSCASTDLLKGLLLQQRDHLECHQRQHHRLAPLPYSVRQFPVLLPHPHTHTHTYTYTYILLAQLPSLRHPHRDPPSFWMLKRTISRTTTLYRHCPCPNTSMLATSSN